MNEAFVYVWCNLNNGKVYVGYHKGKQDDGYISSSHNIDFWEDFNDPDTIWDRVIIYTGLAADCLKFEQKLLKEVDLKGGEYYNNARGAEIIFTDSVLNKMSNSGKLRWQNMSDDDKLIRNKKLSKSKTGIPRSTEVKKKLSDILIGKSLIDRFGAIRAAEIGQKIRNANLGVPKHTEDYKLYLSYLMKGNDYGKYQSKLTRENKRKRFIENNPGKNKSEETKRKISNSKKGKPSKTKGIPRRKVKCPYCSKMGGEGLMHRWHFSNCKKK